MDHTVDQQLIYKMVDGVEIITYLLDYVIVQQFKIKNMFRENYIMVTLNV